VNYKVVKSDGSQITLEADRDALQPSGAVIFLKERKTDGGSEILLPESEKKAFDTVLVLSPVGYLSYEPTYG
jgi:hypothetical protein